GVVVWVSAATTTFTLSLHDALPISCKCLIQIGSFQYPESAHVLLGLGVRSVGDEHPAVGLLPQRLRFGGGGNAAGELPGAGSNRSEEHTSELQSQSNLVCRLLLEKK